MNTTDITQASLPSAAKKPQPFYLKLHVQILIAIALGIVVGYAAPDLGVQLKPLGDFFIKLIKMMIAPIILTTVASGIAKMGGMREVGRVGTRALLYFFGISVVALGFGMLAADLLRPGAGLNIDPAALDTSAVATYVGKGEKMHFVDFMLNIVPDSALSGLANGEILQVIFFAVLLGLGLGALGAANRRVVDVLDDFTQVLFRIIAMIMYVAPLGALGAIAFTIGRYGLGSLQQLGALMLCFFATCFAYIVIVLGALARLSGFSLWRLLRYLKEELVLVLGTSTSESALPQLMTKLENLGVARQTVGLVLPTGYSFNLNGSAVYLTLAALFIAQATNVELTLAQQLGLLAVMVVTSKGAAAVTGAGFITLAATLATTHTVPVAGLALLLGIDRFMSEGRALTNIIGNAVACIAIARWTDGLNRERLTAVLSGSGAKANR